MDIKNRLQMTIVTYNRDIYLERTLNCLLDENSPVKDYSILVFDNNSTDNTHEVVKRFQEKFTNVDYYKNPYNVTSLPNIAKAFEQNTKDYIWVLSDTAHFDWDNWNEVEMAMSKNEDIIVASRSLIPQGCETIPYLLTQACFLSTCIFSKNIINSKVMKNMYDNLYTMFPQLIPVVEHVNNNGKFYYLKKEVICHGHFANKSAQGKYSGWYRSFEINDFYNRNKTMDFILGFGIVISKLKDKKIKEETIDVQYEWLNKFCNEKNHFMSVINNYNEIDDLAQLVDVYLNLGTKHCPVLPQYILSKFPLSEILKNIFYRFIPNKKSYALFKYRAYRIISAITFGEMKEKFSEKKHKYKDIYDTYLRNAIKY